MRKRKDYLLLILMLHPLSLLSFEGTHKYTLFKLECNGIKFPLFSAPTTFSKETLAQDLPLSLFSLTAKLPQKLTARWLQAVFYSCNPDHVFSAKVYLSQEIEKKTTVLELDIKPSDAILLSISEHIPLYCTDQLTNQIGTQFAAINN